MTQDNKQRRKLLIDDYPMMVLPMLAVAIGLSEAIMLQQTFFLLGKFEGKIIDGRRWIRMTDDQWKDQFPFWSRSTIRRLIQKLEKAGYLESQFDNDNPLNRGSWYTVNEEKVEQRPDQKKRKKRADYPNFGQRMAELKKAKSQSPKIGQSEEASHGQDNPDNSPTSKNRTMGDPKIGQPLRDSSLRDSSKKPSLAQPADAGAPDVPQKAVIPETKQKSVDAGKLYLSLGNNRYQGPYAPYSQKRPAGTYLAAESLPADAVIVPLATPGKVLAAAAKKPKAPRERKPPDPVFRWVCAYMGVDVDSTWTSTGHEAHSMKGYIVHEEKARLKQTTPITDEQLAACAERLPGFPVWFPTQCKDCNLPMHRRFQTWIGKWYLAGRPGNAPAAKRAADPNCPHCYGEGMVFSEDDRGYRTSKTCGCVKEVRNG